MYAIWTTMTTEVQEKKKDCFKKKYKQHQEQQLSYF